MQFDEKERLQIHKEVHQHKQKNDGWTAIGTGNLIVFHAKESFDVALTVLTYRWVLKSCQIWFESDQPHASSSSLIGFT